MIYKEITIEFLKAKRIYKSLLGNKDRDQLQANRKLQSQRKINSYNSKNKRILYKLFIKVNNNSLK